MASGRRHGCPHPRRGRTGRASPGNRAAALTSRAWWPAATLVAVTPLVVDPGGHHRFTAARFAFAAAALTAGLVATRRGFVADRLVLRAWLAVLAAAGAATALGVDPLQSLAADPVRLMGWFGIALGFGGFLLGAAPGPGGLRPVIGALLAGSVVVVATGLAQFAVDSGDRPTATLGNAGFLGAYLCLVLPLAASRAVSIRHWRAPTAVLVAGASLLLIATTTRGAWIGGAAGLATMAALRWRRAWPWLAVAVVVAIAVVAPVRIRDTAQGRVDTWDQAITVIAERPILGWGPEGFRTGFAQVVDAGWVRTYGLEQLPDRAHNRFLDVAATTGLVGLAADLALLACVGVALRRSLRAHIVGSETWWGVAGVAGALVGYLVQGLFLFDTFDVSLIAWVLAGVAVASRADAAPGTKNLPARSVLKVTAGAVIVTVFAIANLVGDRLVQSASGAPAASALDSLGQATELRPRALDTYLLAGLVALASDDPVVARRAHELLKGWDDPYVQLRDADVLAHLARLSRSATIADDAVARYRVGLKRAPTNGPGWLGLGTTLLRQGNFGSARTALLRADLLLPNRPEPVLNLATVAFAQDDTAEGCRLIQVAASRPGAPPRAELRRVAPVDCALS